MARRNQDARHLAILQDYYAQHRLIPSYSAISSLLGFRAKNAAAALIRRLEERGYLQKAPNNRLTPTNRFFELPRSASAVPAGVPGSVADVSVGMVSLDTLLVHKPSQTVYVPIKGDSMIGAGLLPGDTAIVERQPTATINDIVVAIVGGELTVKRLVMDHGRYVLKPENQHYSILRPTPLEIFGIVTGSFRSYRRKRS